MISIASVLYDRMEASDGRKMVTVGGALKLLKVFKITADLFL